MRPQFKSLQQRLAMLMLVPVGVLLITAGIAGFWFARKSLLELWQQTAIMELQRQAHGVDMLLSRPKQWIDKLYDPSGTGRHGTPHVQQWILEQLRNTDGVIRLDFDQLQSSEPAHGRMPAAGDSDETRGAISFHAGRFREITPPRYFPGSEYETVSLVSDLSDENGHPIGRMTTVIRFDDLFQDLRASDLWRNFDAFLVDDGGTVLYHRSAGGVRPPAPFTAVAVDSATLAAIRTLPYGTVKSNGYPPARVSGFYHLSEAPWTLVITAPGYDVLAPIIRFGLLYLLCGAAIIALVLSLIRSVAGKSVAAIKKISAAAEKIAEGHFDVSLPVRSADEIGELTRSFNAMARQIKERDQLKRAMNLAMEVQQNFLPRETLRLNGVEIAGRSIYCDETGGDYYDFIQFPEWASDRIGIAVGDVVGHGVAAALLMATTRALLRSRAALPGRPADVITDVNRHLSRDSKYSGNFVTLFYALIDSRARRIHWVRAGHDPAMLYDPVSDAFQELQGKGMALGVDETAQYPEDRFIEFADGQILFIGTDGIWEAQNSEGHFFGKTALRRVIRQSRQRTAEQILEDVIQAIDRFRQTRRIQDDVTMVVVKLGDSGDGTNASLNRQGGSLNINREA
ncbi:MAG: SpoIIE family protein phosphatase [Deltaproteobacteria bacterium]|nr:SpoIIE family protein phosphatase [Deltaproteobacteria bacterium]